MTAVAEFGFFFGDTAGCVELPTEHGALLLLELPAEHGERFLLFFIALDQG